MAAITIRNSKHKILVVGSIYNNKEKLNRIKEIDHKYDLIIINGNLCYPYDNIEEIENNINYINDNKKWIYNLGNYDLEFIIKNNSLKVSEWLKSKSNVIIIEFINQTKITILNGGITSKTNKFNLFNDIEVSFVSYINNKPWHEYYGGAFGYIISNFPQTTDFPSFYNYSAQIGNKYDIMCKTYGQEIDQYGLKETILI